MSRMVTCTRTSTLASSLDDKSGLMGYKAALVLSAVVANRELLNAAQLIDPSGGWRAYKEIVSKADAKVGTIAADEGTTIHGAVEAHVGGRDISHMPDDVLGPARAIMLKIRSMNLEVVATERFTVCEHLTNDMIAGTCDLVLRNRSTGRVFIGDIKTTEVLGKARYSAVAWAIQLAVYANSMPYEGPEPSRDRWGRPTVDLDQVGTWPFEVDRTMGIVFEVERAALAKCNVHVVDLVAGARLAQLAVDVRAARKSSPLLGVQAVGAPVPIDHQIRKVSSNG